MKLKYVIVDEKNQVGPSIPVIQGETKTLSVYWYNENGSPYLADSVTALVAKIMSAPNITSIQKTLATSQITLLQLGTTGPIIGFSFTLAAADTEMMAANNTGLPLSFAATDSDSAVTEGDIYNAFDVSVPLVTT